MISTLSYSALWSPKIADIESCFARAICESGDIQVEGKVKYGVDQPDEEPCEKAFRRLVRSRVTAWVADGGRMVLCYVQGSGRRKRKKKGIGCGSGRRENCGSRRRDCGKIRIWDPGIKRVFQDNTLRTRIGLQVVLDSSPNLIR
ncbi:hypothetical protein Tco_1443097 [Tanacetum coccineum]